MPKKRRKDGMPMEDKQRQLWIGCLLGTIPVIWLALIVAPYISNGLFAQFEELTQALYDPLHLHITENSLRIVLLFLLVYALVIVVFVSTRKNYRRGEEHGSAYWGSVRKVNQKYASKELQTDKILTQNVRISYDGQKHRRNLLTLVCGGSGAGKTRFFAKPNLFQCNTSFVVLDPKGGAIRSRIKSTCAQLNI